MLAQQNYIKVNRIPQEIYLEIFFFKVTTTATSNNVSVDGTFSIFGILLKWNTSFSICLCSKICNWRSQKYTLKRSQEWHCQKCHFIDNTGFNYCFNIIFSSHFVRTINILHK